MSEKRLYLLDAYALIFRAYYALIRVPRMTRDGFNTSAVFGFVNTLEELFRHHRPTHMAVCFDPPGPTFRHEASERYKAGRQETPEDIRRAVPIIKEIVRAYRIPLIEVPGFEADDVIGTLATRAAARGFTTYMMTPDKDFGQLVAPDILQFKPSFRGQDFEVRGVREVCDRYGISEPRQVIDLLALMGDKIDNIPGCPGVGEKTAVRLINDFGSVEGLLAATDRLKGALRKKIEENADLIRHSRFMATIRTDVPVEADAATLECREPDRDRLFAIFRSLEFKGLADRVRRRLDETSATGSLFAAADLDGTAPETRQETREEERAGEPPVRLPDNFTLVASADAAESLGRLLADASETGVALLAAGEGDMEAEWLATGVALPGGDTYVVPASCPEGTALVLDTLARRDILKITPRAKRDYVLAARRRADGLTPMENYYDTSLAHYLLQPDLRHDTDLLAETYLDATLAPEPKVAPRPGAIPGLDTSLPEGVALRCAHEALAALRLKAPLEAEIDARPDAHRLLHGLELPLCRVLAEMELTGVRIDVEALARAADQLNADILRTEEEIFSLVGERFNVASPARVGEILFDRLGLDPKAKKTRTGQYSTSDDVLERLAPLHPSVDLIRRHRRLRKLVSTWLTALPQSINPATGRVHTNYNQTVTATGRISSSNPNLQNIPVRDDLGREIRRAFIADPGCSFLSADYSQIELRLVADLAGDEVMLSAFRHGDDIHAITASKIYKVPVEEVTGEQRRHAKTANFGILYGISAFGLAQRLGISRADARLLIDGYNATFPTVARYMSDTVDLARRQGYVSTILGRRRMQPDINSRNPTVRGYAERNAVNAPIQGSAADIIKTAMISIFAEMERLGLRSRMIMQVHDELNFNVAPGEEAVMSEMVPRLMEAAYRGRVPLTASCGIGPDWLTAH